MGMAVDGTAIDVDIAAIVKDAAIVNMAGTILYQMYQNQVLGSELALAWWDLVAEGRVLDGEPSVECSSGCPWVLEKRMMEGVETN